jgi:hypothetical protein
MGSLILSTMTRKFQTAKDLLTKQIAKSKTLEDPSHAENTMQWIENLKPDADEILLLAGFGHDVERSMPDRLTNDMFSSYEDYKHAHARRAGDIAAEIALKCGYTRNESKRLAHIIAEGEFNSDDAEVQLLCDADSISFFDNNVVYYLSDKGEAVTKKKMSFAYTRASERAKLHIRQIMTRKPELDLLMLAIKQ